MTAPSLTYFELFQAAIVGAMRNIEAIKRDRPEPHGTPTSDLWGIDIEAAAAELLVAKASGLYWHAIAAQPGRLPADVGRSIQVRHTRHADGCLILYEKDPASAEYVLVVGLAPHQRIAGAILGHEGQDRRWWRTNCRTPAFFVPQSALTPWGIDARAA